MLINARLKNMILSRYATFQDTIQEKNNNMSLQTSNEIINCPLHKQINTSNMLYRTAILSTFAVGAFSANVLPREEYEKLFFQWMKTHDVQFKNGAEFIRRLQTFADNHDIIEKHNAQKGVTYTLGHNAYSHMTSEEFSEYFNLGKAIQTPRLRRGNAVHSAPADVTALPASVDWVSAGAVTAVKNQGNCGSCWSFSATGALEGAYEIKNGNLQSFSEQELVSCDTTDGGCNGGWMDDAFAWIKTNGGICTEDAYPYTSGTTGQNGACSKSNCVSVASSAPSSYVDVQEGSVSALMSAVAQQPVSIAIQANQPAFQLYKSGVLTGNCGQRLDHGVLATGYGTWTDGTDYWQVKNSWGESWGMDGYILIERSDADLCGVLDAASYPLV
jgi:C1A family cysteine protease